MLRFTKVEDGLPLCSGDLSRRFTMFVLILLPLIFILKDYVSLLKILPLAIIGLRTKNNMNTKLGSNFMYLVVGIPAFPFSILACQPSNPFFFFFTETT